MQSYASLLCAKKAVAMKSRAADRPRAYFSDFYCILLRVEDMVVAYLIFFIYWKIFSSFISIKFIVAQIKNIKRLPGSWSESGAPESMPSTLWHIFYYLQFFVTWQ